MKGGRHDYFKVFRGEVSPARPSLDSLRKQAKKLAREIAAGDAAALARARAHLPNVDPPLSQRNAQLVDRARIRLRRLARAHGRGQQTPRQGSRVGGRASRARSFTTTTSNLEELLAEYPTLLSWQAAGEPQLAEHGHERLRRRRRRAERTVVHARGVRRAAHRRRRGRDAGGMRRAPQVARQRAARSCFTAKTCCRAR